VINDVAESKKRPVLIGLWMGLFVFSTIIGALIGGTFTSEVTWRWVLLDQSASRCSYRCHGPALPQHPETYQAHTSNMERDFTTARSTRIWLIAFFAHLLHASLANGVARQNRGMTVLSLRPWWRGLH
jgi:hypothetical protein